MAGTVTRAGRPDDVRPARQVLLLSRSAGLAAVLSQMLDPTDRLSRLGSLRELVEGSALDAADVVLVDLPSEDRAAAVGQLRRRYPGPLVVLVARGDDRSALRRDGACRMLTRPFSAGELCAALAIPFPGRPAAPVAATAPAATAPASATAQGPVDPKAAARRAPVPLARTAAPAGGGDRIGRAQRLLASITQGWRARRRLRLAGFSAFALIAFTAAFVLAAQGRCGPGCDAIGTRFSPATPSIAPKVSSAPSTSRPKRAPVSTAAPAGSAATGGYRGVVSVGAPTTTSTTRRATTTTRKPSPGGGGGTVTTRPATTAPPTTAPPTTAPTTTATVPEPPTT